jgi:hypothetical protein
MTTVPPELAAEIARDMPAVSEDLNRLVDLVKAQRIQGLTDVELCAQVYLAMRANPARQAALLGAVAVLKLTTQPGTT